MSSQRSDQSNDTTPMPSLARKMWKVLEPYHTTVYFVPETRTTYTEAGLKGYWMGYFASRAAALGPVGPEVVTALFYNFSPRMVARAIPDAWRFAPPERVLAARYAIASDALRRILGSAADGAEIAEAADLARTAAMACDVAGRALFAAHSALPWPDEPHLRLWHATTLLREYRGDGHVAALLAGGIDGVEAHITLVATGAMPREAIQPHRGWSDDEWEAAETRLRARGWLDDSGSLTDAGRDARQAVEAHTDAAALRPWEAIGPDGCARLHELVFPLSDTIVRSGGLPTPNPLGLSWP
jgi:Helix-turn-helix family